MVTRRTPKTREIEFVIAAYLTYRQILSQTRCRVDDSMTRGFTQWFKTWPYVHFVFLKEKSFQKKKKQKKTFISLLPFQPYLNKRALEAPTVEQRKARQFSFVLYPRSSNKCLLPLPSW